jgi:hypothetical protein
VNQPPITPQLTPGQREKLVALFVSLMQDHGTNWAMLEMTMDELARACVPNAGGDVAAQLARAHEAAVHVAEALRAEGRRMRLAYDAMCASMPDLREAAQCRPAPSSETAIH